MDSELLYARIKDTADICERTSKCKYLGFLSAEQAAAAKKYLEKRSLNYGFFGGYESAQRVMLGCFPDWVTEEEYPISAVTFLFRKSDTLAHRDVLGSLMGLGLTRDSVGDILIGEGKAIVFLSEDITDYVITQTEKIGKTGVKCINGFEGELPESDKLAEFSTTIASERLDCVVAALCGISRGLALEKISQGLVSVNSFVTDKITLSVNKDDVITVRGKGKFIVSSLNNRTRKNRLVLNYKKYV